MKTSSLPNRIVEAATKRFPHLAHVSDAKTFCQNLCRLEMVRGITFSDYFRIAAVANGGAWEDSSN